MNNTELENSLIIFTDGSSLGNPGPGGYGALIVYPKLDEIVELGGSKPMTTNNEMELSAIIAALSYAINSSTTIHIYTDSQYAINGITAWMHGWAKNGWKTKTGEDIKNKSLWQTLHSLMSERPKDSVTFHHVRGHVGVAGNERVDDIARELGEGKNVKLFRGKISEYPIKDILHIPDISEQEEKAQKKSGKAYSYVSIVDGEFHRDATWAECEARTTGRKSKFKKALSKEHEEEIMKEWGVSE